LPDQTKADDHQVLAQLRLTAPDGVQAPNAPSFTERSCERNCAFRRAFSSTNSLIRCCLAKHSLQ